MKQSKSRLFSSLFTLILVFLLVFPTSVFAEGELPPEGTEPTATEQPLEEPTPQPTEQAAVEEPATTPEGTEPTEPTPTPIVVSAEDVVTLAENNVLIVDESGNPVPLTTETALTVLADPDPYLCSAPSTDPASDPNCTSYVGVVNGINPLQRAVNDALEGYYIYVEPGVYDSNYNAPLAASCPGCASNDKWAPALIISTNNLCLYALDSSGVPGDGIGDVVIQSKHTVWSNPVAVTYATGGDITGYIASPAAVIIVASGVTLDGFTIFRPNLCGGSSDCYFNNPGVLIGGTYAGDNSYPTAGTVHNNTVSNNAIGTIDNPVWHGVYIWNSDNNIIENNVVKADPFNHWAAMSIYDGGTDTPPNSSQGNIIRNNDFSHGIAVGAWPGTTDNSGTIITGNIATRIGISYSNSTGIVISGNTLTDIRNWGYDMSHMLTDLQLTSNTISAPSGAGVDLRYMTNATIANNVVTAGTGNGFQLFYMFGGHIYNNQVSSRTSNGIAVLYSNGTEIYSNLVQNNGASGIVLVGSDAIDVYHNQVYRNTGNPDNPGGITVREGNSNIDIYCNDISGNTIGIALNRAVGLAGSIININAYHNLIYGNQVGIQNNTTDAAITANDNFWGGPGCPGDAGCDTKVENTGAISTLSCWIDEDEDGFFAENRCGLPVDNCPTVYNPDQLDSDSDGIGDACDITPLPEQPPAGAGGGIIPVTALIPITGEVVFTTLVLVFLAGLLLLGAVLIVYGLSYRSQE